MLQFGCKVALKGEVSTHFFDEMGSIETLFSVGDEVKNWAYFVVIPEPPCTPKTLNFSDPLSSLGAFNLFSESGSGDWDINSVPTGGKLRVTTQFESPPVSQIWRSNYEYTPSHPNEIIEFVFSIKGQLISVVGGSSGQLFNFFLIQNGLLDSGGFQELYSFSSITLSRTVSPATFTPGTPIYLAIGFGNSSGSTPPYIRVADYWDFACTVNVTCP